MQWVRSCGRAVPSGFVRQGVRAGIMRWLISIGAGDEANEGARFAQKSSQRPKLE